MAREDTYESPFSGRYTSPEMKALFSDGEKFKTWRRFWTAVARGTHALGGPVSAEEVADLEAHVGEIDFAMARKIEKEIRHDVMAHVRTFAAACPAGGKIIHAGLTSCEPTDNSELIVMRKAIELLIRRLGGVVQTLASFAEGQRDMPTLGRTHLQAAQPTTVGKRAALWLLDLVMDLEKLCWLYEWLPFRGIKGAVGTQAEMLQLFDGDAAKVRELERLVAAEFGFTRVVPVSGQTYTRKIDSEVVNALASLAASAHKICEDIRLLASMKEIEEPFEAEQVGSSAMPYKRNPMRSERCCGLARYVMSLPANTLGTHAQQMFERTLDDSANRRIVISEAFLGADAILILLQNILGGLVVFEKVIERNLRAELPFIASVGLLNAMVKRGADRQECHERIRIHAQAAGDEVKLHGRDNNLLHRIRADEYFRPVWDEIEEIFDPRKFVGLAPDQVTRFLSEEVNVALWRATDLLPVQEAAITNEITV